MLATKQQIAKSEEVLKGRLASFLLGEKINLPDWMNKYFYLAAGVSYDEQQWVSTPPQALILGLLGNDIIEFVAIQKSARVGYTKLMLGNGLFKVTNGRSVVFYQPTDSKAREFSQTELTKTVSTIPKVLERFPCWNKKHAKNTQEKKECDNGSSLRIRGATSGNNFRMITVQEVYVDELDGCPVNVDGEGSVVGLSWMRVKADNRRKQVIGSTPTIKGESLIEKEVQACKYNFHFFIDCPNCAEGIDLRFGGRDSDYGLKFDNHDPLTTKYQCEHCLTRFTQDEYLESAETTMRMVDTENEIVTLDGEIFEDFNGVEVETPKRVAIPSFWTIHSPFVRWSEIIQEFLEKKDDPLKFREFVNLTLGETYEDRSSTNIKPNVLQDREEDYSYDAIPNSICWITCGVDVQPDRFEIHYVGWGVNEFEAWELGYEVVMCDTSRLSTYNIRLTPLIFYKKFIRQDGVELKISHTAYDTGGTHTQTAYDFYTTNSEAKLRALPIKGVSKINSDRPIIDKYKPSSWKSKAGGTVKGHPVNSDAAKDMAYTLFSNETQGEYHLHFSSNKKPPYYYEGLVSEKKYTHLDSKGRHVGVWRHDKKTPNEPLDTFNYAMAAYIYGKPQNMASYMETLFNDTSNKEDLLAHFKNR